MFNQQPRFLWQGVLILLPAFLLAGFGFYSLQQDRALALLEATREAKELVEEISGRLEQSLRIDRRHSPPDGVARLDFPLSTEEPTRRIQRERGAIVAYLNSDGRLSYPVPARETPLPIPLDLSNEPDPFPAVWKELTRKTEKGEEPGDIESLAASIEGLQVSDRSRALARHRLAEKALESGNPDFAIEVWTELFQEAGPIIVQ